MTTHQATAIDYALVSRSHEPPPSGEVVRRRKTARETGRRLEVSEQDRGRTASRIRNNLHPCEMGEIPLRGHHRQRRHTRCGLVDQGGAGKRPVSSVYPHTHRSDHQPRASEARAPLRVTHRCRKVRLQAREEVLHLWSQAVGEVIRRIWQVREDPAAERRKLVRLVVDTVRPCTSIRATLPAGRKRDLRYNLSARI